LNNSITVLGAGSIGISTAIHLQQRGWEVTLIDRKKPANETSYGNAGVINASSFIPLNNPALFKKIPSLLLNNKPYLRYQLSHVLRNLPWLYHFLHRARPATMQATVTALNQLTAHALDEHKAIMQRAGNMHRLTETGWLKLFRHGEGLQSDSLEARLYQQNGVTTEALSAADIHALEPSLAAIFSSGFLLSDSAQVNNPGQLLKEYTAQFAHDGGRVLETNIHKISHDGGQESLFELHAESGNISTERLVLAAGPWSDDLLRPLGYRVLLGYERGYHQHFHFAPGVTLNRPIHDIDAGYILIPMEQGARITTGVELNHRDAPSNYAQLEQVLPRAREAIGLAEATADPIWRGVRPTFPDSRPVIDRAPAHDKLWLAFGHQHIGLMTGPISGKLLSQMISNEATDIDMTPFNAKRWIRKNGRN